VVMFANCYRMFQGLWVLSTVLLFVSVVLFILELLVCSGKLGVHV
jgi:hypothetical protein